MTVQVSLCQTLSETPKTGFLASRLICGKQRKNKYERLLLFNKGAKTSHCELIEKHLRVEILSSVSYSDHVCRNCIRKLVTTENSVLKLVSTFNEMAISIVSVKPY